VSSHNLRKTMMMRRLLSTTTKSINSKDKLVVLCVLDGWGYREAARHNAVLQAFTPNFDALFGSGSQRGMMSFLDASERHVGLPANQIGNSEVGHMNIGAGRVVWQDICTIDNAIEDESLSSAEALREHVKMLKSTGGTSHLMGLVSPGGVHSLQSHVSTLANLLVKEGIPVKIHAFTDGRDVGPRDAERSFSKFLDSLDEGAEVVTVSGRYYAMDRDHRWDRVKLAYDAIVSADSPHVYETPEEAISSAYERGETDEFVKPSIVSSSYKGIDASGRDAIMMANFRADRAREILEALACPLSPCENTFPSENRPNLSLCTLLLSCASTTTTTTTTTTTHIYRYGYGKILRCTRGIYVCNISS
jgi:2,3-bisphosphoglycerate-independent phosphoglycerate mutase